jgi:acyl-CoA reductase-like NAD-dependent aldehyde dehydrogenase
MMGANAIPALVTGNTVVSVPAPSTALVASELARCFAAADLPAGVFNFVTGLGHVVGAAAAGHRDVDAVAFTGSAVTGAAVAIASAGKSQLLELGGNGPTVVLDDADLDLVIPELLSSAFLVAGQACTGAEWVLVQDGIHDELLARLTSAVQEQIRLGDPLDPETRMGPLNNAQLVTKVQQHIDQAVAAGASICTGGELQKEMPTDLYFQPTVLSDVTGDMDIACEETFGPVIPVQRITDENEALAAMERSTYGLAAAVFTGDLERGLRFAEAAPTGNVNVNLGSTWTEPQLPFGGGSGKSSGIGRSQGRYPLTDTFTELKTVILQLR